MTERERSCWEQFCRTGLISDYLEYRGAVDCRRGAPEEGHAPEEDSRYAAWDQRGGALGQKPGGI